MINVAGITRAIEKTLSLEHKFADVTVVRGDVVNDDPSVAVNGWIGIYRNKISYSPHTLGKGGRNWDAEVTIFIVVQMTSFSSGEDCEDRLEELIIDVLTTVNSNRDIRQTIDMITGLDITYTYDRDNEESTYYQQAIIELKGKTGAPR